MKLLIKTMVLSGVLAAGLALGQTPTNTTGPGAGRVGMRARIQRRLIKALALTDAQKQQAQSIRQTTKAQAQPLAQQLKTARQELAAAVQAGDQTKIQQAAQNVGNLQGQLLAVRSRGKAQFYAILTPEQKAKAAEFQQKVKQRLGKDNGD
jgi:Spy/CpxP family protein refolding chaperone